MLRSSTLTFGLSLWTLTACGAPAELDEGRFPRPEATGYVDGQTNATGGAPNGGAPNNQGGNVGVVGAGGSDPVSQGGSENAGGSSSQAGNAQTGGTDQGPANGGSGNSDGCPDDITVLFARPKAQGGCTDGGGCHEAQSPIAPDLVSPNVASRLLNVPSSCSNLSTGESVGPRPFISAGDSYLQEKIDGSPYVDCGFSMPFLVPQNLNAADKQCIIDWIAEVAGGGG